MGDRYNQIYAFILYSLILGFSFGVLYDFFRIIRMTFCVPDIIASAKKNNKHRKQFCVNLIVFICDICFFIIAACICSIFIFHANNGNIRGIALAGSLIGFIIYYNTIGRLVTIVSGFIIRTVYNFIRFIIIRIFKPLLLLILSGGRFVIDTVCRLDKYLYTKRSMRSIITAAKRGFR